MEKEKPKRNHRGTTKTCLTPIFLNYTKKDTSKHIVRNANIQDFLGLSGYRENGNAGKNRNATNAQYAEK